jgi:hypothetical protein
VLDPCQVDRDLRWAWAREEGNKHQPRKPQVRVARWLVRHRSFTNRKNPAPTTRRDDTSGAHRRPCSPPNTPFVVSLVESEPEPWRDLPGARYVLEYAATRFRPREDWETICTWVVENPMGSSHCTLSLASNPRSRRVAIHSELQHCEFPESAIFAMVPRAVAEDQERLFEVLYAMFQRNDGGGLFLLKCPPHAVGVGSVLDRALIKRLFTDSAEVKGCTISPRFASSSDSRG